jgi:hypothetical protein
VVLDFRANPLSILYLRLERVLVWSGVLGNEGKAAVYKRRSPAWLPDSFEVTILSLGGK